MARPIKRYRIRVRGRGRQRNDIDPDLLMQALLAMVGRTGLEPVTERL
jgi:hypothetical protein